MKGLVYETSVLDPDEVCMLKVNRNEKDCASPYPKYPLCVFMIPLLYRPISAEFTFNECSYPKFFTLAL